MTTKEIFLSELIDDNDVLKALVDDDAEKNHPKKQRIYQVPIPEDLKFHHTPESINTFIERLYPNMKFYILCRTRDPQNVDNIINNFVLYMLDNNKKGQPRYTMYDPIRYPGQPYYRWFISNLRYFWLSYRQQLIKDQFKVTLSETDYESTAGSPANNAAHIDIVSMDNLQEPPDSIFFISELIEWLRNFSSKHSDFHCFEAHAFDLFKSRIEGEENNKFAERMKISPSAASQWNLKLKKLVTKYLEGDSEYATA